MTINENSYNRVQINYTIRRNANDELIEKNTMINIRDDDPTEAMKLYKDLKSQLNGDLKASNAENANPADGKEANSLFSEDDQSCPECGAELKLRQGKNGSFYGCTNYPSCRFTKKA